MAANTGIAVRDLRGERPDVVLTLAEEVRERDERAEWSAVAELLAQVHELLQLMRNEHLVGLGVKRHALPEMRRIPRPGDPPPTRNAISPREFALLTKGA